MSEVKRIEIDHKGLPFSDENGVYVFYEDYAKLEVQLANAESKYRELTAENAGLKNPENWLSQSDYGYEASEVATQNGATEGESLRAGMVAIINRIETPATDAFLAEVRAQGVEMFAKNAEGAEQGNGLMKAIARRAAKFADQLRKGAAL
nr:MAG TPA: hypothetical protein [Caudoviricetes sp.]